MAGAITGISELSYGASGAIVANRFAKVTAEQTVLTCSVSGEEAVGVAKNDISAAEATAGKLTAVQELGIAWVEAAAAIALNAQVMTSANGRATTATTGLTVLGICRKACSNAGELCLVDLSGAGHILAP